MSIDPHPRRTSAPAIARTTSVYLFLGAYFIVVVFPMVWMLYTSFKTSDDVLANTWMPPLHPTVANYRIALSEADMARYFLNSVVVVSVSVLGVVLLGAMAAYALAPVALFGREALYLFLISAMMVPPQLSMAPLFSLLGSLGLLNTYTGLILVYVARSLPFTIFVLRSFFATLPGDLREAGIVEGASEWRAFWEIMFPLARPGLIVVAIFNFLWLWNEYLFALMIMARPERQTLPLGIANLLVVMNYRSQWGAVFAGLAIILLPTLIVYLLLHRRIVAGMTVGALKG